MNINEPLKFCLVNPGTMGEPEVLQALLGPNIKPITVTLDGFSIGKQEEPYIHSNPNKSPQTIDIKKIIYGEWNDKGFPFPGAWTLVKNEGSRAEVRGVEFGSKDEIKVAIKKLDDWNFHHTRKTEDMEPDDILSKDDEWFGYSAFRVGDTVYLTEMLKDKPENLLPVEHDYREKPGYRAAVAEMVRQAMVSKEGPQVAVEQGIKIS